MTTVEIRAPHPALALPGFTRAVELSTGITVHIRRVDRTAFTMALSRHFAAQGQLDQMVADGANLADQLGFVLELRHRIFKASLIQPTLPELLALYGGDLEQEDFGLGCDLEILDLAIAEFSPEKTTERQTLPLPAQE
ncbi:hypothetical protein K7W42_20260 [Deinococcus sp. HMF7604]|uniref:hypothetical protein n=1 Tax=Deinococcus betulae TaxID=2873312 RepID=UPI001CCB7F5D|nr:hypothetical protein [Deinococcus betulae]MBZ9753173.1 hypothetical protein [Deinococcus betulae]